MAEDMKFPDGFYWGAATSAFQVEGGIKNMDWEKAAEEGRVPHIGRAANHYHRYEEDFDIAKGLGHNAHRFSIEWARIEPKEGVFDEKEIKHYRDVLMALQERNIEPFITLWHFTLPLWFSESGGFERKDAAEIFARYCEKVVSELGDLCEHFSTQNEPNVYAGHGWLYGAWPPFKRARILWKKLGKEDGTSDRTGAVVRFRHFLLYFKVEKHLIKAHKLAYTAIKKRFPHIQVSVVKHVRVFEANKNPFNVLLAAVMQYLQTYRFMNAVCSYVDEIGINYYRHTKFGEDRSFLKTDMGWDVYPSGMYKALMVLKRYDKPIYIAEAGLADDDDDMRADYIKTQIAAAWRALNDGVDLRAHMYWSLLDNYELALGYDKRFGLVEIDYDTLQRKIRPSAYVYKNIIDRNAVDTSGH